MQKYVKRDGHEQLTNVPADLDTKPYRDEHDFELLRRMIAATERGPVPSPQSKVALRRTVGKVMGEVDTRRRQATGVDPNRGDRHVLRCAPRSTIGGRLRNFRFEAIERLHRLCGRFGLAWAAPAAWGSCFQAVVAFIERCKGLRA
jgi:hypothetical protein